MKERTKFSSNSIPPIRIPSSSPGLYAPSNNTKRIAMFLFTYLPSRFFTAWTNCSISSSFRRSFDWIFWYLSLNEPGVIHSTIGS